MKKLIRKLEKYNRRDYENIQKIASIIDNTCEPLIVDFLTLLIDELQIIRKANDNSINKIDWLKQLQDCQPQYLKHMAKIIECAKITPEILPYINDMTIYVEKWAKTIDKLKRV